MDIKIVYLFISLIICCFGFSNYAFSKASESGVENNRSIFNVLVRRLNYNPDDLGAGDKLREHCRLKSISSDCINELNSLTKKYPRNKFLRYQAALAYVDEVPGHSLFRQGWLSSRSMSHMTEVIEWEPNDWPAYYIRGLNGLYWPTLFHKLPRAITDLQFCINLSDKLPKGLLKPYHVLAFVALGDAYVKDGDVSKGQEIYKKGLSLHKSSELEKRLRMSSEKLTEFIKEFRHTDRTVDTEISFLLDGGASKL